MNIPHGDNSSGSAEGETDAADRTDGTSGAVASDEGEDERGDPCDATSGTRAGVSPDAGTAVTAASDAGDVAGDVEDNGDAVAAGDVSCWASAGTTVRTASTMRNPRRVAPVADFIIIPVPRSY
jgi:hypothetical protein